MVQGVIIAFRLQPSLTTVLSAVLPFDLTEERCKPALGFNGCRLIHCSVKHLVETNAMVKIPVENAPQNKTARTLCLNKVNHFELIQQIK